MVRTSKNLPMYDPEVWAHCGHSPKWVLGEPTLYVVFGSGTPSSASRYCRNQLSMHNVEKAGSGRNIKDELVLFLVLGCYDLVTVRYDETVTVLTYQYEAWSLLINSGMVEESLIS